MNRAAARATTEPALRLLSAGPPRAILESVAEACTIAGRIVARRSALPGAATPSPVPAQPASGERPTTLRAMPRVDTRPLEELELDERGRVVGERATLIPSG